MKNNNSSERIMLMLVAAALITGGITVYFVDTATNPTHETKRWTQRQINTGIALCTQYDGRAYFEDDQLYCTTIDNTFEVPKIPKPENTPP